MIDTALHFSGGKDSLACLYLMRDRWSEIYVMWVNTGAADPSIVEYMDGWKERLPYFVEVKSDQPANVAQFGWPSDVVPARNTALGSQVCGGGPLIQSCYDCCLANIWYPLHRATLELGVSTVIKGQRASDKRKSTATNGQQVAGVTYRMPIEAWSDTDVFDYLAGVNAIMPPGYGRGETTSRDCWDCTGYLDENAKRIANLDAPRRDEINNRLRAIRRAVAREMEANA
jgi:3'-phosphoadenosine 5'-phosphosulfate sulfotransferase (PAPS reductase)/FAD synthetase